MFLLTLLLTVVITGGCKHEREVPDYVARVGDEYLTREDMNAVLAALPPGTDTTEAQHQFVEQWVANALLYREARRRGLQDDADVQRMLAENDRSVMVNALLSRMYKEEPSSPSPSEVAAYFGQYKEQLRLREPFVRVRYLSNGNADSAQAARRALLDMPKASADSAWQVIARRFATDVDGSLDLSRNFYPESRLFTDAPEVHDAVTALRDGQVSDVIKRDSARFDVVQVVERVPAGSIPQIAWIQDELAQRVAIHDRKQMYAREVQRLRNEALAREELDLPE
ncbi:MAG TPA: peptidyl-prolyl cis-trans isomerase [Rhodothermales bacterium]|nr:peptidyl-prolyl cis-trans isomerase [Rhodothermales bacterium]